MAHLVSQEKSAADVEKERKLQELELKVKMYEDMKQVRVAVCVHVCVCVCVRVCVCDGSVFPVPCSNKRLTTSSFRATMRRKWRN